RATAAVFLSIPLSALGAFIILYFGGSSVNSMILGGLALAFSRLIDNSVVPLFCARLIKGHAALDDDAAPVSGGWGTRFNRWFNRKFEVMLERYDRSVQATLLRPVATLVGLVGICVMSMGLIPRLGLAYFPRTDPGQFVVNLKAPTGLKLAMTEKLVKRVEDIISQEVRPKDLDVVVSNIGATPGYSSMYTSNSATPTAFVQASLKQDHKIGSYEYMDRVRERIHRELPQLTSYFQSGGLVDAVLNLGLPTPIDVQVSGSNLKAAYATAAGLAGRIRGLPGVSDVLIPQDIDAPSLRLDVDRVRASELGLSQKEVVSNVITALTSNAMIAPSYWVDPRTGNDYMLTVQYPEDAV